MIAEAPADLGRLWETPPCGIRRTELIVRAIDLARATEWLWRTLPRHPWVGDEDRRQLGARLLFARWLYQEGRLTS